MKKYLYYIVAAMLLVAAGYTSCKKDKDKPITVSVGAQSGEMTEGATGTVTFQVTTDNLVDGTFTPTVENLPTSVSVQGSVTIKDDKGTLTLAGDGAQTGGEYPTLTLKLAGAKSKEFTLTVKDKPEFVQDVKVNEPQSDPLYAGTKGETSYKVYTTNITNGTYTVTVDGLPTGVTVMRDVTISNDGGTLSLAGDADTETGEYMLTLHIANAMLDQFKLIITKSSVAPQTVTVEKQDGGLVAGKPGDVKFGLFTENVDEGKYQVTVTNLPTGVSVHNDPVAIDKDGKGTLILIGDNTTVPGTYTGLMLKIENATEEFQLNIDLP